MGTNIKDPITFASSIEIFTIAVVASLIAWKFLNAVYDYFYSPVMDTIIDKNGGSKYYMEIGDKTIPIGKFTSDFIKWCIIFIILMIIYFYWQGN